jgi:hypothetical protein
MKADVKGFCQYTHFVAGKAHHFLNFAFLQFEKCSQDSNMPDTAHLWLVVISAVGGCIGAGAPNE